MTSVAPWNATACWATLCPVLTIVYVCLLCQYCIVLIDIILFCNQSVFSEEEPSTLLACWLLQRSQMGFWRCIRSTHQDGAYWPQQDCFPIHQHRIDCHLLGSFHWFHRFSLQAIRTSPVKITPTSSQCCYSWNYFQPAHWDTTAQNSWPWHTEPDSCDLTELACSL